MGTFETTKTALISKLKDILLHKKCSTVYDIVRPIFYCSLPFGMTQFDILTEKKFKDLLWIMLWNGAVIIVTSVLAVIALTSRTFEINVGIIYNITDVASAWVSVINNDVIIVFGFIFKNKVNYFHF